MSKRKVPAARPSAGSPRSWITEAVASERTPAYRLSRAIHRLCCAVATAATRLKTTERPAPQHAAVAEIVDYAEDVRRSREDFLEAIEEPSERQSALLFCFALNRWLVAAEWHAGFGEVPPIAEWMIQGEAFSEDLWSIDPSSRGLGQQLTVSDAAKVTGIEKGCISRLCNEGKVASNGRGRARRVSLRSLAEYFIQRSQNGQRLVAPKLRDNFLLPKDQGDPHSP